MTLTQIKKSMKLFASNNATKELHHANVRKHIAALKYLGNNHILAVPVQRKGSAV